MTAPAQAPDAEPILLNGEDATRALAARIALLTDAGDVIALSGPLGAGKSVFARGVITTLLEQKGLSADEVPSPTFTLVQTYWAGERPIYHFDLFRLNAPDEAWELGIEDAFADGISLIEWPERLGNLLPKKHLAVRLASGVTPEQRIARLIPHGTWSDRLLEAGLV